LRQALTALPAFTVSAEERGSFEEISRRSAPDLIGGSGATPLLNGRGCPVKPDNAPFFQGRVASGIGFDKAVCSSVIELAQATSLRSRK
jgi:hypothetical protein